MIQYPDGTTGIAEMSCEEPPLGFSWYAKQVEWSLGDYVWGKISGYPWWPGIVSPDPDLGIFTKMQGRSRIYHIQFFGDAEETGWVHSTLLMKFEGKKAFDEYVKNILQNARPSEKLRLEKLYREFAGCVDDLNDAVKETESYLQSKENKMKHSITDQQEEDEKETAVSDITQESLTGLKSNVSKFSTKKRNSLDDESEDDEDIDQDYEELITVQVIIDEELLENDKIGEKFAVGHKKEVDNTVSCHDKSLNQVHACIGHEMDEQDHSNNDFVVKPRHTQLSSIVDVQMSHTNQNVESMSDSGIYKDRLKSCSVSLQRLSMNSVKLLKQGTVPTSHIITGKYHQDHKNVLPDEKEHQVDNNTKQKTKIINVTSTNGENQINSSLPITLENTSKLIDYTTTVHVTNEDGEVQNCHSIETDNTHSLPETIQDRDFSSQTEKDLHLSPYVQDINNSGNGHENLVGGLCDSYQEIKSQNTVADIKNTDEHYVDKIGSGNDGVVKNGIHNNRTIPVAIESASSDRELKERNNKSSSKDFAEEVINTTVSKEMHEICPINLDLCNGVDGEEHDRNILTERIDQNIGNQVSRRTRTKLTKTKLTNNASNIIPFKCNICDRTIGDLIGLKMHLQAHANLNAYSHSYKHSNREEQLKLCSVALTPISKYAGNRLKTGSISVSMLKGYPPSQQKNARRSRGSSTVSDSEQMCISDTKSKTDNIINAPSKHQQNEKEISKETINASNKNGRNKRESKNKDSQQSGKNYMVRQHKDILVKCPKDKLRGINLTKITEKNKNKKNGLNKPVSSIEYSRCNMMTNHVNRNELSTEITRDPLKSAEEQNVLKDVKKTSISTVFGKSPSGNDKKIRCSKTPNKDNYSHSIGKTRKRKISMKSNLSCTTKVARINSKIIEKSVEKKKKDLKANGKEKAGHIDLPKHLKGNSVCKTKDRSTTSDKTPEMHVSNNLSNNTLKKGKKKQFYCDKCEKHFRQQRELDVHKPCNAHIKTFKCLFCDRAFSLDYNRTKHEKIHTGDGQCECSICHKTFSCAAYLKHHVMLHTGEYPVRCKICDRGFPNESTLSHHMKIRHTDERPFECDICGKRFKSKHTLKEHLISHTGEKPYKCSLCDKRYTKTCKRKLHEESFHHGIKRHSCQYCGIKFAKLYSLQQHLNKHTGEKRYKCRVCDKLFPYYSTCRTHEREIHEAVKPFKCSECGVAFTKKEKLEEHKLFHLRKSKTARIKEQLYSCELCDKKFTVPSSLKDHMNIHLGLKPYKCTLCDRAFSKPNSLRDHYKRTVHEGERSFTCDCCGHTFGMKIILDKHVKNFTGERPFQCHFCDRRFPMKCGLDKHISQNHVGDDTYECKICHVKLKGSSMKRHMKSHGQTDGDDSDQPNFKCSTCGVPFKKKGSLLSHIRLNHSGTSTQSILFNCSICGINFNEQKGLNKHKEIKHKIKNEKKRGTTCECSICGIAYIAKRDMEKHIKGQHVEKSSNKNIIECSSCKVIFTSKSVMNKHKQIKHGAKPYEPKHLFECRVCGIKLRSSQSRKNHEMSVHPDRSSQPSKKADRKGSA